jgi:hypothetical protein
VRVILGITLSRMRESERSACELVVGKPGSEPKRQGGALQCPCIFLLAKKGRRRECRRRRCCSKLAS